MNALRVLTPGRLHFGLLGWGPDAPRQFGGVGLMVEQPQIQLTVRVASHWSARGPLADRVLRVAHSVAAEVRAPCLAFEIESAPREHAGLGVGTQLSLAVAQAVIVLSGQTDLSLDRLARLTGRGLRSGVGLHGFRHGGFLIDGGRGRQSAIPPLLARHPFPNDWWILLVTPEHGPALHGAPEASAFATLPPVPSRTTDRLCRKVLLELLPALLEHDLESFGRALTDLQREVGLCFAPIQGGPLASPESAAIVAFMRSVGLHGVGQSSWGPTLYGFSAEPPATRQRVADDLVAQFPSLRGACAWTRANETGSRFSDHDL